MSRVIDISGNRYGRLLVLERFGKTGDGKATWKCVCACGREVVVSGKDLRSGNTRSCGCLQKETAASRHTIHSISSTRLYKIWMQMKERCYNPNTPQYKDWGGRGITVCDDWLNNVQAFYGWAMNNGYADDLSLDRIDNNKGYSPDNCRWATREDQCNNKRTNRLITYNGKTQTISQWADELGINYYTLQSRITKYKWSIEKALTTP